MLVFNGLKFAKNDSEFMDTLFQKDGTASGYYKKLKGGIKLYNIQNELIAFIKAPSRGDNAFIVTAYKTGEGKDRYMFGLSSLTEKYLCLSGMGYMKQIETCEEVFNHV